MLGKQSGNCDSRIWNRATTWLANGENLLFVALVLVHLIPLWSFKYFPSQDGPAHLENATILREYYHPDRSIYQKYYLINTSNASNWFSHLVLAGLMYFVPMFVAEKILLSGYVVLLPVSVRYSLSAINPNTRFLAFMSFPFVYNFPFHMGFYNFSYSLAMFFLMIGFWLKNREHFAPRKILMLALISLLTYFVHIVSLVMACLGIALMALIDLLRNTRLKPVDVWSLWRVFKRRVSPLLLAVLPTFFFVMAFVSQQEVEISYKISVLSRIKRLCTLYSSLCSYDITEVWLSVSLVCLFAVVSSLVFISKVRQWRQLDTWDELLFVVCAYVLVYFMAPQKIGEGTMMNARLTLYPFFALILWLGAQSYRTMMKRTIIIISTSIALVFLGLYANKYAELNPYIAEYLEGLHLVEPNTTLLPICFSPHGCSPDGQRLSRRVAPFPHLSSYIAAKKHIVKLNNYEALYSCFPLIYRKSLNPLKHIAMPKRIETVPAELDFLSYPKRTEGSVDYVLLYGCNRKPLNYEAANSIFEQLRQGYDLIYTLPNKKTIQLYRQQDL